MTMQAHEASVSKGSRIHAVMLAKLPVYSERRDQVYLTVCKEQVRGSNVYPTVFGSEGTPYIPCDTCSKRIKAMTMNVEGRMEQILTLLDRATAQGFSAETVVEVYQAGKRAEAVIQIKGTGYRLTLTEEE
jgi:hypothetical protein